MLCAFCEDRARAARIACAAGKPGNVTVPAAYAGMSRTSVARGFRHIDLSGRCAGCWKSGALVAAGFAFGVLTGPRLIAARTMRLVGAHAAHFSASVAICAWIAHRRLLPCPRPSRCPHLMAWAQRDPRVFEEATQLLQGRHGCGRVGAAAQRVRLANPTEVFRPPTSSSSSPEMCERDVPNCT